MPYKPPPSHALRTRHGSNIPLSWRGRRTAYGGRRGVKDVMHQLVEGGARKGGLPRRAFVKQAAEGPQV